MRDMTEADVATATAATQPRKRGGKIKASKRGHTRMNTIWRMERDDRIIHNELARHGRR